MDATLKKNNKGGKRLATGSQPMKSAAHSSGTHLQKTDRFATLTQLSHKLTPTNPVRDSGAQKETFTAADGAVSPKAGAGASVRTSPTAKTASAKENSRKSGKQVKKQSQPPVSNPAKPAVSTKSAGKQAAAQSKPLPAVSSARTSTKVLLLHQAKDWAVAQWASLSTWISMHWQSGRQKLRRARRRWQHIVREKRACHFPESNRPPIQFFLFLSGMLPMLVDRIREHTWGHRRQIINIFAQIRSKLEGLKMHPAAFLGIAGAVAVLALFFSFYTVGTTVSYKGEVIASVPSELSAKTACADVERLTTRALGETYKLDETSIQYSSGLLARKEMVDTSTLEETLSEEIGLVTYGYSLYVDGALIGSTPYEGALEELLQQLKDGIADENTISCDFAESVEIKAEYVPTEQIMNLGYLAELLYSTKTAEVTYTVVKGDTWSEIAESHGITSKELLALNPGYDIARISIGEVLTLSTAVPYLTLVVTEREHYVEQIPYDIEYTDSANLFKGDYKVLSAGQYGSADTVANVTYINGEETERQILSSVTLVNPVTEQQARGTKERPSWMATGTFRWPCSGRITSSFGYRNLSYSYASKNHKGIDIANKRGTAIYAADGGTVVYAGWMSGYGYLVQINHGNGYVTYYGHNSSLTVSKGQHVYKGQQIARMGSTGNSTGNHCHFEIRYNGVPKNPLNYI